MKHVLSKLFRWQPDKVTLVPAIAGVVVIALSVAMIPAKQAPWLYILLRDVAMVSLVGILFPLLYIIRNGKDWTGFGLSFKRWYVFLPVNCRYTGSAYHRTRSLTMISSKPIPNHTIWRNETNQEMLVPFQLYQHRGTHFYRLAT